MLDRLLHLLDLERIEENMFRGANPPREGDQPGPPGRVVGGQVASQALRAASNTVPVERPVHSLHAYFLRPGRLGVPILYSVDRIRDGGSFTTRRVVAIQNGEAIFNLSASFHAEEPGPEYQLPAPADVPDPEGVDDDRPGRPVIHREFEPSPPTSTRRVWLKAAGSLPDDDPALHACVLAYASDSGPVGAAARPVRDAEPMMRASLDHTMWFHRAVRADEWLIYDLHCVATAAGRGLARGSMFTQDGLLAVSVNQEVLLRPRR